MGRSCMVFGLMCKFLATVPQELSCLHLVTCTTTSWPSIDMIQLHPVILINPRILITPMVTIMPTSAAPQSQAVALLTTDASSSQSCAMCIPATHASARLSALASIAAPTGAWLAGLCVASLADAKNEAKLVACVGHPPLGTPAYMV